MARPLAKGKMSVMPGTTVNLQEVTYATFKQIFLNLGASVAHLLYLTTVSTGYYATIPNNSSISYSCVITVAGDIADFEANLKPSGTSFATMELLQEELARIALLTVGLVSTKTALTAAAPTAVAVGVASAQAVAANPNRKGLVLVNTSNNTISFGLGAAAAVLNSGITLTAGGVWVMDEYTFTTAAINAIASVAASTLGIQEFT